MQTNDSPYILGVGNRFRRDDGVGPAAAEILAAQGVDALAVDGDGATLATLWEGRSTVIVIDAMQSGRSQREPGAIRRLDANAGELPHGCGFFNSHAFGLAQAVETARALGRLPPRLIIFGVEGDDFGWGEMLSPAVAAALPTVLAAVMTEIGHYPPADDKGNTPCGNGSAL